MQTSQDTLEFEPLAIDNDYEIARDHYPYIIRKRSNHRVLKETLMKNGYKCVKLNGKLHYVHRVVATQWIENDDIEHKTVIDHIDHNRSNNRLQNLRWVTQRDNSINRSSQGDNKFEYREELGDDAFEVTSYNGHDFDNLWFDPEANCFYIYTGAAYREMHYYKHKSGALYIRTQDIQLVQATITLSKFKQSLEDDDDEE